MELNQNYEFLRDALARLGFVGILDRPLETALKLGNPQFELPAKLDIKDGSMHFAFKFAKGEVRPGDDPLKPTYFLNNVNTVLKREGLANVTHNFILFKQRGYDIREMKNLLEGRYVDSSFRKDGRVVDMWRQINFEKKDEYDNNELRPVYTNGEFDLKRQLNLPAFSGINEQDKVMLIEALKKGDQAKVSVKQGNTRELVNVIAAPHIRQLLVFDEKGERMNLSANKLSAVTEEPGKEKLPDATQQILQNQQEQQEQSQQQNQGQGRRKTA